LKRTRLGRNIARLLAIARYLNAHPDVSLDELEERLAAQRKSRPKDLVNSRREFLKTSALLTAGCVGASPLLNSCALLAKKSLALSGEKVIILGAGMAGLSAAFHLTKAGIPCSIYESAGRTGGRIFTQYNFNSDSQTCELGGELVDTNNADLIGLAAEFHIPIRAFKDEDYGLEQNLYFIKNKYYTDRDLIPAFQKFAKHLDLAKKDGPEKIDRLSLEEYLSQIKDVDAWIIEIIRIAYLGESGVEASDQSALMMVGTIDSDFSQGTRFFGESDEALRIDGGNSTLTKAIEKYLLSQGVEIHFGTPLVAIQALSQKLELHFLKDNARLQVAARRTICTIPFSILRNVEGISSLALNPLKSEYIKQMLYATNSKMMMGFKKRLWRGAIESIGRGVRVPASNGMVYSDLFDQNLWESSRLQKGASGILTSFVGGHSGEKMAPELLGVYLESVEQIFPGTFKIFDSNSSAFNWSKYVHTKGSYAAFRPGQMTKFQDIGAQPELSGQLLFAGEHVTKEFGGFMNGAALSGRKAAEHIISGTGRN